MVIPETIDFCIVKATEGFRYVDPYCDGFVQQCVRKGIRWGFYHFARNNQPEQEAQFFWENTSGYVGKGIPVLDIEDDRIGDWGAYSQRFVDKYHAITGVYPIVYCSAAYLSRFNGYPIVDTCGLWVAGYPSAAQVGLKDVPKFPYSVSPWKFAAIWQFSNNCWIDGWDEPVDVDVAYMDNRAWDLYATCGERESSEVTTQWPSIGEKKEWTLKGDGIEVNVKLS